MLHATWRSCFGRFAAPCFAFVSIATLLRFLPARLSLLCSLGAEPLELSSALLALLRLRLEVASGSRRSGDALPCPGDAVEPKCSGEEDEESDEGETGDAGTGELIARSESGSNCICWSLIAFGYRSWSIGTSISKLVSGADASVSTYDAPIWLPNAIGAGSKPGSMS